MRTLKYALTVLTTSITVLNAALFQPTNLKLTPTNSSIALSWNDTNTQEVGYKIFRNGILIAIVAKDSQSYIDRDLTPDKLYRYTIKATDKDTKLEDVKKDRFVFGYQHFHQMTDEINKKIDWDILTHVGWHFLRLTNDADSSKKVKILTHEFLYSDEYDKDGDQLIWPTANQGESLNDPKLKQAKKHLEFLHQKNLKIYLGVKLEDDVTEHNLADKLWREKAITLLIDAMIRGGADGLDIDIENDSVNIDRDNLPASLVRIENLYKFIKELRFELDKRELYDKAIHIAAPIHFGSINSFKNSPIRKILDLVDSYFVMGYDILWTQKAASQSLFRLNEDYANQNPTYKTDYGWSIIRAIADLTKGLDDDMRSKIILGVPYYSYKFITQNEDFAALKLDDEHWGGEEFSYGDIYKTIKDNKLHINYDETTQTPWIVWRENSKWYQSYFENVKSLKVKYDFINQQHLGGVGMWSIGEYQDSEFDTLVTNYFKTTQILKIGSKAKPIVINQFPFHENRDTTDGFSYFNYYGGECNINKKEYGSEFVYELNIAKKGTLSVTLSNPDLDIHILDELKESNCLAQKGSSLSKVLEKGKYYLVVDSRVEHFVDKKGVYDLRVEFEEE